MPKHSAGLLLYRLARGGAEVLLVHPGGPFYARKDDGYWSIPKGEVEPGESPLELRIGPRVVRLGEGYRVAARNASLKAELDRLLSPAPAPPVPAHA